MVREPHVTVQIIRIYSSLDYDQYPKAILLNVFKTNGKFNIVLVHYWEAYIKKAPRLFFVELGLVISSLV